MAVVGAAQVLVVPSFKGFQKSVGKEMSGLGNNAEIGRSGRGVGSKLIGGIGGALKVGAKTAGVAVAAVLGTALVKGFGRLNEIEQAKASLLGLGHSAKEVQGIMDNALAAVKGTAFGMGEAATVAAGAVAAGIKPGKELEKNLRLVADAATIAKVPMSEMGAIFNKVASSNKIQGDTIAQLNDKGIPIVQLLGKKLGVTSDVVTKMAKKGQIDFKTFSSAMQSGMGGSALKSGDTMSGAFKNMLASLGRTGANLLSGVYPKIKGVFTGLTKAMAPLEAGAKKVGAVLGDAFVRIGDAAKGLYALFVKGDFTTAFRKAFHVEEDSSLVNFLFNIREGFGFAVDAVKLFVGSITGAGADVDLGKWMDPIIDAGAKVRDTFDVIVKGFTDIKDAAAPMLPALEKIGKALLPLFKASGSSAQNSGPGVLATAFGLLKGAVKGLATILTAVGDFAEKHGTAFRVMAVSVGASVVAFKAMSLAFKGIDAVTKAGGLLKYAQTINVVKTATAAWSVVTRTATLVQKAFKLVFLTNPFVAIIAGLILLGAGLVLAYKKSQTFRDIVNGVWKAIKDGASAVVNWFTGSFVPFFTKTIPAAFQSVLTWVKSHWGLLVSILGGPIGAAVVQIIKHRDTIMGAFRAIGDAAGKVWSAMKTAWDGVKGAISSTVGWLTGTAWPAIKGVYDAVVNGAKSLWASLQPTFKAVGAAFSAVGSVFRSVWTGFLSPVFQLIGAIAKAVLHKIVGDAIHFAQVAWAKMGDAFRAVYNSVIKPVIGWFQTAIDGWKRLFGIAVGAARTAWSAMGTAFKTVYNMVVKPVIGWFQDRIDTAKKAFGTAMGAIKTAWSATGAFIKSIYNTVITVVVGWFNARIADAKKGFGTAMGAIKTAWSATGALIKRVYNATISPVVGWFNARIGDAKRLFGEAIGGIKQAWSDLGAGIKWVYQHTISPVIGWFKDRIDSVKGTFKTAVDGIGTEWGRLEELAKKPIRFVVNTVINGGLIAGFNKLATIFKTDKINPIQLPPGFAAGGQVGGYSPHARADNIPAMLTADEWVIRQRSSQRMDREHPGLLGHINAFGTLPGFADGGKASWWDTIKAGIKSTAGLGGAAGAAGDALTAYDMVKNAPAQLRSLAEGLLSKVPGGGTIRDVAIGMGRRVLDGVLGLAGKALAAMKDAATASDGASNSGGGGPLTGGAHLTGSWQGLMALINKRFPGMQPTSKPFRPGAIIHGTNILSQHAKGKAVDLPVSRALWNFLLPMRGQLWDLLGPWGGFFHGGPAVYNRADHQNHIHASVYDQGGILPPGGVGINLSRQPETIRNQAQEAALHANGATYNVYAQNDKAAELVDELMWRVRLNNRGGVYAGAR